MVCSIRKFCQTIDYISYVNKYYQFSPGTKQDAHKRVLALDIQSLMNTTLVLMIRGWIRTRNLKHAHLRCGQPGSPPPPPREHDPGSTSPNPPQTKTQTKTTPLSELYMTLISCRFNELFIIPHEVKKVV